MMKIQFIKKNMHILLWGIVFLVLYFIFSGGEVENDDVKNSQFNGKIRQEDQGPCSDENIKKRLPYFYKYSDAGYSHLAADLMKDCFFLNIDAEIKKEIAAEISRSYVRTIGDDSADILERKYAAVELKKIAPALYEEYINVIELVIKQADEVESSNARKQDVADKEAAKKLGVYIGMSRSQVEGSSWGSPDKTQVIAHARGSTEIWFYGASQSLMFENDRLVQIMQ